MTGCAFLLAAAAAVGSLAPVPESRWTVKTYGQDDAVALGRSGGVLTVDWSILPKTPRISGCFRYTGGWADILLDNPIALLDECERVVFELWNKEKIPGAKVLLFPIVTDSDGERFVYAAAEMPQIRGASVAWRLMRTPSFYAGEAGAAAQDVFELDGDGVDFTPSGKLTFAGFRLMVRMEGAAGKNASERRSGTLAIGDVMFAGGVMPYSDPFAYADSFLPASGRFRFAARVSNAFQATPVREFVQTVDFDADSLDSRRQRLVFPLGPDGNYWIDYQIVGADGSVVRTGSLREDAHLNPDKTPPRPVDEAKAPPFGAMRINPGHAGRGVYEKGERPEIVVRVFRKQGERLSLKWTLMPCDEAFTNVLASGSVDDASGDVRICPPTFPGRSAYRIRVAASSGGRTVDEQTYAFGVRTDHSERHDRAGAVVDRRELKKHPYNRTTYCPRMERLKTEDEYLADYREFLDESREMASSFTYMVDLKDFQALEGVYDSYLLDKVLDLAADRGMKVTVRAAHADLDKRNLYRWNRYSRQYGWDGLEAEGHRYYGAYSVMDRDTLDVWLGCYRALYDRYRAHTAFEGYYIMQPGGEWTVVDEPWRGVFSGYDPGTVRDYRRWLDAEYGGDHSAVEPPLPDFRGGARPDLRREWLDWCRYKSSLGGEWMKKSVEAIREYDDDRVTIAYANPLVVTRLLGGKLDYGHNGGNHFNRFVGDFIDPCKRFRVGWISEPHHPHAWAAYGDPADRGWVLHWTTWMMTAQAAGGGANIHVYFRPWNGRSRLGSYGGVQAFDMFNALKPVLDELHEMDVVANPTRIAFASDSYTLFAKHRTTFRARLDDLRLYRELLEEDVVPSGDFVEERADDYLLVLPNLTDEVMSKKSYDSCVAAVRRGAKAIVAAKTGSYVPELGTTEPFRLLAGLGIDPPASEYCRKGLKVEATVGAGCPLFAEGRRIVFETGDRHHVQLLDPEVQSHFWKYRYRWIPETDYYGYFPGVRPNGRVLATFPDGGAAMSLHKFGKGEVVVFWGTPDIDGDNLRGMMSAAADWAGYRNPLAGCPVRHFIEGRNESLGRHYLLLWNEKPGTFVVPVPNVPDGEYFLDDPVSQMRIGLRSGREMREGGLSLTWHEGHSPLKYVRMIPRDRAGFNKSGGWAAKYGGGKEER